MQEHGWFRNSNHSGNTVMARLVILSGELAGKTFELIDGRITVGRSADNNIRIDDKTVSGHHCILTMEGQDYVLKDLNSTNGSRVNGRRVVEIRLANGDNIRLGDVDLRYESEHRKAVQPLPPPSRGVDLSTVTPPSVPPISMESASPFRQRVNKTSWVLNGIILLLVLIALVALFLVFGKYLLSPQ